MAHVPHLLVRGPWSGDVIEVSPTQHRHLSAVLRREPGSPVSYTDGTGTLGEGEWSGTGIRRGDEGLVPEPAAALTLAVAPPDSKDRVRWLVEKCTELGVARIRWLVTRHGQGRIPRPDRSTAWMQAALEQSRRSRLTIVDSDWSRFSDLDRYVVADLGGEPFRPTGSTTVAIGPEGGWDLQEVEGADKVSLGSTVLRSETAAVSAAAVFAASLLGG